jgi:hypothetical protein
MKRGIRLEKEVFNILRKSFPDIRKSGLYISPSHPFFGASPDGETPDSIFEIKCPMSQRTVKNFIKDGRVQPKVYSQIQLQLMLAGKQKGFLVIASPTFETDKKIDQYQVNFDKNHCENLVKKCMIFYESSVFNRLLIS